MARKRTTPKKKVRLGKLPPMHTFFLNPYRDDRFTRCPKCGAPMKARKKPFVIHVDPHVLLNLNMTGRYCPACDLMILHKDVLEDLLVRAFTLHDPSIIGNDYLIMGTLERKAWRELQTQPRNYALLFDNMHDFKEVVTFEPVHYDWAPDPDKKDET
jgi:hypothetical protein